MDRVNLKMYLILALALGILLILILIVTYINQKKQETKPPYETPTPTSITSPSNFVPTNKLSPTLIHPTGFTGVFEEELPPDIKSLSEQKQALKSLVPFVQPQFNIDFDCGEDKCVVNLNGPKDQSLTSFENWLKSNYPSLPLDRFIIN